MNNISPQKKATTIATSVASFLTLLKLVIAITSGSVAVLASAVDSLLDTAISVFNFFAIKKSEEDANNEFQYGKGKIQAIASVIEGTVISVSGLFVIYKAIEKLISNSASSMITASILVMIVSVIATFFLVRYLGAVAKKTDNIVIKADATHYKTDLYSNIAVLLSLLIIAVSGLEWVDGIFGLAIGIYIVYSAYDIIKVGIEILLDRALDGEMVAKIAEIISKQPNTTSYHWLKTRTDGSTNFVEFHLVLKPNMTLHEAHGISDDIEDKIRDLNPKKRWLITPHYDPYDDENINEISLHG